MATNLNVLITFMSKSPYLLLISFIFCLFQFWIRLNPRKYWDHSWIKFDSRTGPQISSWHQRIKFETQTPHCVFLLNDLKWLLMHIAHVGWRTVKWWESVKKKSEMLNNFLLVMLKGFNFYIWKALDKWMQ